MQKAAPGSETKPAPQGEHAVAPADAANEFVAHGVQTGDAGDAANVPGAQAEHAVAPALLEYVPGLHPLHSFAPVALDADPGAQRRQDVKYGYSDDVEFVALP